MPTGRTSASTVASTWSWQNADQDNTRDGASQIDVANVTDSTVAWTIPIVGVKGAIGFFSSTPVFGPGGTTAYLQDLGNSVYAVNAETV